MENINEISKQTSADFHDSLSAMPHAEVKNMEDKKDKIMKKLEFLMESKETDPNGSYTGIVADDIYDTPVQDVDDL